MTGKSQSPQKKLVQVESANQLNVGRILGIQVDHFITKDTFWYGVAWAQAIFIFWYWPRQARDVWPKVMACLNPDVQNGVIQALTVQNVSKEESANCLWLPEGYKVTYS